MHSSSPAPQCACPWISLQGQVYPTGLWLPPQSWDCATCPCSTCLLPAASRSLLWLSTPVPRYLGRTLSSQAGWFPSHFSLSSRKTILLLLLIGLQHEFKQMRQLWSQLASPLIPLNLNSPFQTHKREAPGYREGLGRERGGWNPPTEAVWTCERESTGEGAAEEWKQ